MSGKKQTNPIHSMSGFGVKKNKDSDESEGYGLYVHVPFCTKKCPYCHFFVTLDKEENKQRYLNDLALEWGLVRDRFGGKAPRTIYLGGGTPALLGPDGIERILKMIQADCPFDSNEIEITLEGNPENITAEQIREFRSTGVNRLSLGVQSFDDELLKKLGRSHTGEKAKSAVFAALEGGIENVTIDLMYDLPGQSLASWEETLRVVGGLPVAHLSLYNLTIEPGTPYHRKQKQLIKMLPTEEESSVMVKMAIAELPKYGLKQYEISAFAKAGHQSQHNRSYWVGRPFYGLGPSAFSYWEGARFRNVANLVEYHKRCESGERPVDFVEALEPEAKRRELFLIAIRLLEGVDLDLFQQRHGEISSEMWIELRKQETLGLIRIEGPRALLTEQGRLFYDTLATAIV